MAVAGTLSDPEGGLGVEYAFSAHEAASLLGSFSFEPDAPRAGEPIGFDGSGSSDLGHTIERYEWDFGDGSHGTGATPSHTYAKPGDYSVTLTLADDEGVTAEISHLVTVTASPPPPLGLTVKIEKGQGTVVSDPTGISCTGAAPHECTSEEVAAGSVTLTASPQAGYLFKSWKGCKAVNGRQCTVDLVAPGKTVGVRFVKAWSLTASKAGTGQGTVTTLPGGIGCISACTSATALYEEGALTLKEKPARHSHFIEWLGGTGSAASCAGLTSETCSFTIGADSSIEAKFVEDAKHTLSFEAQGDGQGSAKTKPAGISCGFTCTKAVASFYANEEPEVSVTLGKGTTSLTWSSGAGTCTGSTNPCKVPMGADRDLVAKLE